MPVEGNQVHGNASESRQAGPAASRRGTLKGAAWSVPALAAALTAPSTVASTPPAYVIQAGLPNRPIPAGSQICFYVSKVGTPVPTTMAFTTTEPVNTPISPSFVTVNGVGNYCVTIDNNTNIYKGTNVYATIGTVQAQWTRSVMANSYFWTIATLGGTVVARGQVKYGQTPTFTQTGAIVAGTSYRMACRVVNSIGTTSPYMTSTCGADPANPAWASTGLQSPNQTVTVTPSAPGTFTLAYSAADMRAPGTVVVSAPREAGMADAVEGDANPSESAAETPGEGIVETAPGEAAFGPADSDGTTVEPETGSSPETAPLS